MKRLAFLLTCLALVASFHVATLAVPQISAVSTFDISTCSNRTSSYSGMFYLALILSAPAVQATNDITARFHHAACEAVPVSHWTKNIAARDAEIAETAAAAKLSHYERLTGYTDYVAEYLKFMAKTGSRKDTTSPLAKLPISLADDSYSAAAEHKFDYLANPKNIKITLSAAHPSLNKRQERETFEEPGPRNMGIIWVILGLFLVALAYGVFGVIRFHYEQKTHRREWKRNMDIQNTGDGEPQAPPLFQPPAYDDHMFVSAFEMSRLRTQIQAPQRVHLAVYSVHHAPDAPRPASTASTNRSVRSARADSPTDSDSVTLANVAAPQPVRPFSFELSGPAIPEPEIETPPRRADRLRKE